MTIYSLEVLFSQFQTSPCLILSCFLTCIHISQEAGQVVWYSYLLKNFPQFVAIHTKALFSVVSEAEVKVFLEFLAFSMIQWLLAFWSLAPLPFLNPSWTSGSSQLTYCWSWYREFWAFLPQHEKSVQLCSSLMFFGIGMKTDLFQSSGHCWVFQICWHIERSTLTA